MERSRFAVALAWHDVTCPEGGECRDRHLHALEAPLVASSVLHRFLEKLGCPHEQGYQRLREHLFRETRA